MNRPRVLRRPSSIYRLALLDLREPAWERERESARNLALARHDAARCSMLDEKSVSHDNRVQRSDNAYIIVDAFPSLPSPPLCTLGWEKKSICTHRCTKMTAEFNIMQWIYPLHRYTPHSLTLQRHNESQADLGGISQSHSSLYSAAKFCFSLVSTFFQLERNKGRKR